MSQLGTDLLWCGGGNGGDDQESHRRPLGSDLLSHTHSLSLFLSLSLLLKALDRKMGLEVLAQPQISILQEPGWSEVPSPTWVVMHKPGAGCATARTVPH